jgi:hypothetical protein
MMYSQNHIRQSSQTASFKGMSSIRSRSRRPSGQASHMPHWACALRPGNRMTLPMATPPKGAVTALLPHRASNCLCCEGLLGRGLLNDEEVRAPFAVDAKLLQFQVDIKLLRFDD